VSQWLVTGAGGMLGRDLVLGLQREHAEVAGYSRRELDITDAAAVRAALDRVRPAVVVNCAAWTAVDDAETHEETAFLVNGSSWQWLGRATSCSTSRG
jgi:dTDP-4-dehydrorhamnose reductase